MNVTHMTRQDIPIRDLMTSWARGEEEETDIVVKGSSLHQQFILHNPIALFERNNFSSRHAATTSRTFEALRVQPQLAGTR